MLGEGQQEVASVDGMKVSGEGEEEEEGGGRGKEAHARKP